jgi:heme-degrading monooxygenase HmoA
MFVVSVTRLRLRSWWYLPGFVFFAFRSRMQTMKAGGNRGLNLMRELGNVFWTATVWDSEQDMKRFMISGAHGRAMPRLLDWCDEASVARWEQESAALPAWQEAHRRMVAEGRRSKVRFPSAAHERFEIPPPRR